MAILKTTNYLKLVPTDGTPFQPIDSKKQGGALSVSYDTYTLAAELDSDDEIYTSIRLPKGALVLGIGFSKAADSSAGIVDVVSVAADDMTDSGTVILDGSVNYNDGTNGIFDFGGESLNNIVPCFHTVTEDEEAIKLVSTETSIASDGDTFTIALFYAMA